MSVKKLNNVIVILLLLSCIIGCTKSNTPITKANENIKPTNLPTPIASTTELTPMTIDDPIASKEPTPLPTITTDTNKNIYLFPNSDTNPLNKSELENCSVYQLLVGKNEIFARHGYVFKSDILSSYFDNCSWYNKNYDYSGSFGSLTKIEQNNFTLIDSAYKLKFNSELQNAFLNIPKPTDHSKEKEYVSVINLPEMVEPIFIDTFGDGNGAVHAYCYKYDVKTSKVSQFADFTCDMRQIFYDSSTKSIVAGTNKTVKDDGTPHTTKGYPTTLVCYSYYGIDGKSSSENILVSDFRVKDNIKTYLCHNYTNYYIYTNADPTTFNEISKNEYFTKIKNYKLINLVFNSYENSIKNEIINPSTSLKLATSTDAPINIYDIISINKFDDGFVVQDKFNIYYKQTGDIKYHEIAFTDAHRYQDGVYEKDNCIYFSADGSLYKVNMNEGTLENIANNYGGDFKDSAKYIYVGENNFLYYLADDVTNTTKSDSDFINCKKQIMRLNLTNKIGTQLINNVYDNIKYMNGYIYFTRKKADIDNSTCICRISHDGTEYRMLFFAPKINDYTVDNNDIYSIVQDDSISKYPMIYTMNINDSTPTKLTETEIDHSSSRILTTSKYIFTWSTDPNSYGNMLRYNLDGTGQTKVKRGLGNIVEFIDNQIYYSGDENHLFKDDYVGEYDKPKSAMGTLIN